MSFCIALKEGLVKLPTIETVSVGEQTGHIIIGTEGKKRLLIFESATKKISFSEITQMAEKVFGVSDPQRIRLTPRQELYPRVFRRQGDGYDGAIEITID